MKPSRFITLCLLIPGAGFIFICLAAAMVMTALQSVGLYSLVGSSQFTWENWQSLNDKTFADSFIFTVKVAALSAFGTLAFAYPLALFLRRRQFGTRYIGAIVKIPLFVPSLVAAFLILNILAFHGILNSALIGLGITSEPFRMLNDKFGWNVFLVQIWKNLPFELLIIMAALQTVQSDLEDAASNLGASPLLVIWHILLPLSAPGIMIAVTLVFILTFGDYAITKVAGPVYPPSLSVLMFTKALTLHQWGVAACIGIVITAASLLFVALYARGAKAMQEFGK